MAPGVVGSIPIGHPNTREYAWYAAPVAQLDRALASEAKGRRFDSCRAHHLELSFAIADRVVEGETGR